VGGGGTRTQKKESDPVLVGRKGGESRRALWKFIFGAADGKVTEGGGERGKQRTCEVRRTFPVTRLVPQPNA